MSARPNVPGEAWSRYWQRGFLTTFSAGEGANYVGPIRDFWVDAFSHVPDGGTVVDCASGNGAVLSLAHDTFLSRQSPPQLIAVDYADVGASPFFRDHPEVRAVGNTPIEDMPLPDHSADLVTSQFGFEYADPERAVPAMARILRPGGRFAALVHHAESDVSRASNVALGQIADTTTSGFPEAARALLRHLDGLRASGADPKTDTQAATLRDTLNARAKGLIERRNAAEDSSHYDFVLDEVSSVFSARARDMDLATKLSVIDAMETEAEAYRQRMEAMVSAAHDEAGAKTLLARFAAQGLEVKPLRAMNVGSEPIAWMLRASALTR